MKYTLQSGVAHPFLPKFTDNLRFILPLIAVLLLVILFGIHNIRPQHTQKPLTLGIYTVKTPATGSTTTTGGGGSSNGGGTAVSSTAPGDYQPINSAASSSLQTDGGLSSAVPTTSSSGQVQGSTPPMPSPAPSTFPCLDISTGVAFVCTYQACTPPILLMGSQKAWTATTGTCVIVN